MKSIALAVCLAVVAEGGFAAELRVTTFEKPWQDQSSEIGGAACGAAATVKVERDRTDQTVIGFGTAMSELSHEALWLLSDADRAKVMDEIFSSEGGGFTVIRTPIGASDFAKGFYSYCETPDDFEMKTFSTDHDDATLIPLIREVQKRVPADVLKIWGSPWCPPRWMKTNRNAVSRPAAVNDLTEEGRIFEGEDGFVCDDAHMKAYALYFRKYVESYRAKGIPLWMVMPQNEFNSDQNFPSCTWSVGQLAKFIGRYLGPALEGSGVELYFGTMERPNPDMLNAVLERPAYAKYVTGAGFQWAGKDALPRVRDRFPNLTYVMSEQECGDGRNDWKHALHCWDLMLHYLSNGVSVYDYWNLALQKDGLSHWGWRQNSLVVVDAATRTAVLTPEYCLLKHLSHYVRRGAKRLVTDGSHADVLAFVNPDKSVVVMMANKEPAPKAVSVCLDGKTQSVTLPASSVATLWIASAAGAPAASVDGLRAKAADLVAQMTVDEKCAQLRNEAPAIPRLGIPAYNYWSEALHGVGRNGRATMFPMPIGMAASFDPALVREIADAIATEGRIKHAASVKLGNGWRWCTGLTFWSPNINIFRDPRWGRGMETWGEDPYLTGEMGTAFVKGLQGDDPVYLKAAACAKHFAVHSGPEALRHAFDVNPSKKDLYETYLPAFEKLVREGKVEAVMGAYNRVYGESASASPFLLKTLLRDAWGFQGHVVSDCGAVCDIWRGHKIVKTPPEAAALAIRNGLTFECGPCFQHLKAGIEKGYVTMKEVDAALTQLLLTRFKLGILGNDPDCPYNAVDPNLLCCDRHRELARKMARESMVLVKNDGVLPLDPSKGSYAVVGAGATDVFSLMGNYYGTSERMVSYLEGITAAVDAGTDVAYRPTFLYGDERHVGAAPWSDVIIAIVGLTGIFEGEEGDAIASASNGDRATLDLPVEQMKFLDKLQGMRKNGKKVVVVVTGGSPVALQKVAELSDAVVLAWYAGEEGGNALADLLFGKADFTGRLPLTFPESVDVLPPFEDYAMVGRTYKYQTKGVAYPFGYGLSYAKFKVEKLKSCRVEKSDGGEMVEVVVKNVGNRDGTAVVQLYVSTPNAGKGAPLKSLVGFRRVPVRAGETQTVEFDVSPRQLMEFGEDGVARRVPGECIYTVQL